MSDRDTKGKNGKNSTGLDRRGFLKSGTALAGCGLLPEAAFGSDECPVPPPSFSLRKKRPALAGLTGEKAPNILLIITDQERWRGNLPSLARPAFDRLCENGVSFDNAFCSYPLCSPSRSSIFSGMYPHQNGVTNNLIFPVGQEELDPRMPHIGSVLASAGYRIGYKGKWDLSKSWDYYLANLNNRGSAGDYGFEWHCENPPNQEYGYIADDEVVRQACDWIGEQSHDRPWFLCCSIINPHDICHPRLKPDDTVRPEAKLPGNLKDDLLDKPADQKERRDNDLARLKKILNPTGKSPHEYKERDWKKFLTFYYDLIEMTDKYIEQLLYALHRNGMADDTIIVYTSDHGELGGAHGFKGKYEFYEEALHIPMVVSHPKIDRSDVSAMVSNVSIAPTIASMAGVEWPADIPGRDLSGWITGDGGPDEEAVFSEHETNIRIGQYYNAGRMVRTRRWKYSYSFYDVQDGQLYDLDSDPLEMHNLFHDPGHRKIRKELEEVLRSWQRETGDHLKLP
jgi:arylsulfatase A-like enzyme